MDRTEAIFSKLKHLDDMLDIMEKTVKDNDVVFNMPKASGIIKMCQDRMMLILSALQEASVKFWLDSHSLLAACRTGYLLPWETKVYIGMTDDTWMSLGEANDDLAKKGIVENDGIFTLSGNLGLDAVKPEVVICLWTEMDERICTENVNLPKESIYPLKKMNLMNMSFDAPHKPWEVMRTEFGEDWKKVV